MNRRIFVFICLLPTVFLPAVLTEAQQPAKVPRIGCLVGGSRSSESAREDAFRQGLRELGYVEGQNIIFVYRFAEGKLDKLPELATELVTSKVDVIVAEAPAAVRAAKNATSTIPIIMAHGGDPVAQGFVASLARPGANVTGLSNFSAELSGKRLELLREAFPKATPVAVIWNPEAPGPLLSFKELEIAAKALKVQLQSLPVRGPNDFEGAFQAARERVGSLVVIQDVVTVTHLKRIVELAAKHRVPAIYMEKEFAEAGGLMSYGPSQSDMFRRAATYVDKILKGTKPADLPVEQPTKLELIINLKAAKQIGLTVPPNVLVRADKVIR
ncbi:MAG TPA: ABC transporter substrate-binding protein [Candidatus Binatia bacterium]|jgi:putative ABC transport system substrate-binding protein|nr:ABC transporter substrate-binding protein [Candidatus Binatia bacterium]